METDETARVLVDHPVAAAQALLPSLLGRIAVVTGASSGLGAETAKWLALRGCDEVVLAVRNADKAAAVVEAIVAEWGERVPDLASRLVTMELDLADLASVRAFAAAYGARHERLDILVNNAGVNAPFGAKTADGFEMMWGVNHLGTTLLTAELMPQLLAAPRAVVSNCSSAAAGSWAPAGLVPESEEGLGQMALYGRSKAANCVFTVELQRRLDAAGITHVRTTGSHPGWTTTGLIDRMSVFFRFVNYVCGQNVQMGSTPQLASIGAGLLPADDPRSAAKTKFFGPSCVGGLRGPPHEIPIFREAETTDEDLGRRVWDLTNAQIGVAKWAFEA